MASRTWAWWPASRTLSAVCSSPAIRITSPKSSARPTGEPHLRRYRPERIQRDVCRGVCGPSKAGRTGFRAVHLGRDRTGRGRADDVHAADDGGPRRESRRHLEGHAPPETVASPANRTARTSACLRGQTLTRERPAEVGYYATQQQPLSYRMYYPSHDFRNGGMLRRNRRLRCSKISVTLCESCFMPRVDDGRSSVVGAGHRREHRDFQRRQRPVVEARAGQRPRLARPVAPYGRNDMATSSSDYGFSARTADGQNIRTTFSYPMYQQFVADNRTMSDLFAARPTAA